jgi:predicted nucleic acid-binding protein
MDKALLDTDIFSEIFKGKHAGVIAKASDYYAKW